MELPSPIKNLFEKLGISYSSSKKTIKGQNIPIASAGDGSVQIFVFGDLNVPGLNKERKKEILESLMERYDFGLGREDISTEETELVTENLSNERFLSKFKPYLKLEDMAALIASTAVISLEDRKKNDAALLHKKKLNKAYGRRGKMIYNFARSGILERDVLKFIDVLEASGFHLEKIKSIFSDYWEKIIECHPTAIFVSEYDEESDIENQARERLRTQQFTEIYSRGNRLIKIAAAVGKVLEREGYFVYALPKYKLSINPAQIIVITKEKIKLNHGKKKLKHFKN